MSLKHDMITLASTFAKFLESFFIISMIFFWIPVSSRAVVFYLHDVCPDLDFILIVVSEIAWSDV